MAGRQLIVFDFDWSLADQDTDRWVMEVLGPDLRRKMKNSKDDVQWTDLGTVMSRALRARVKRSEIEHALQIMPFHPAMIRGVRKLKDQADPKTTFFILSNANEVFIKTILAAKGITDIFDEIVTNPAQWDGELLSIRRRISPDSPQHSCSVGCSPNMCKGDEITAFLARHAPDFDRVIYVGDGSNDFCPALRLRSQDLLLCRRYRGLEKRIAKENERAETALARGETVHNVLKLKCGIKYWAGAWEVEEILGELEKP